MPTSLNTTWATNRRTSSAIDRRRSSVNAGKLAGLRCSLASRSSSSHQKTNAWMPRAARGSRSIRSASSRTSLTVNCMQPATRASRAASGSTRQMKRDRRPTISCGGSLPGSPMVGSVGKAMSGGAVAGRGGLGGQHQATGRGQVGGGGKIPGHVGRCGHVEARRSRVRTSIASVVVWASLESPGINRRGEHIASNIRRRPVDRAAGARHRHRPPAPGSGRRSPPAARLASDASHS